MIKGKKVSIIFPAYNEEKNIAQAIDDFKKLRFIDEIIVVDNNSQDNTKKISLKKHVVVVTEKKQGYGYALRKGLSVATGDYIFLCEPDGTFRSVDAKKLLKYADNYDVVIGTRTNKKFINKSANMHGLLRWGNIILAKLIQFLYRPSCTLSDCGCTFRLLKKNVVKKILPQLTVGGSHFLSELLVLILKKNY
ncbi:MAG TPA: glycosyltransferase family 2 protein, partial [Verrucomicrobiae bacterium]|nr:glycosyltransferase family 2 protein [Verrucomicrobiae bacterium]